MRQFDICANADAVSRRVIPYWLIVQHDFIDMVRSRVCLPLIPAAGVSPVGGLMLEVRVGSRRFYANVFEITHVPQGMLGKQAANVSNQRQDILDAIDLLTHGV